MGSSSKPKSRVAEYYCSLHVGLSHAVDQVLEVFVKEKSIWKGYCPDNRLIKIGKLMLFGGIKKEGGLFGEMHVLHGRSSQVVPSTLASKLGTTQANAPGFRDILSLFFTGPDGVRGFYWSANYPYLHSIWVKVKRTMTGWYNSKREIPLETPTEGITSTTSVVWHDGYALSNVTPYYTSATYMDELGNVVAFTKGDDDSETHTLYVKQVTAGGATVNLGSFYYEHQYGYYSYAMEMIPGWADAPVAMAKLYRSGKFYLDIYDTFGATLSSVEIPAGGVVNYSSQFCHRRGMTLIASPVNNKIYNGSLATVKDFAGNAYGGINEVFIGVNGIYYTTTGRYVVYCNDDWEELWAVQIDGITTPSSTAKLVVREHSEGVAVAKMYKKRFLVSETGYTLWAEDTGQPVMFDWSGGHFYRDNKWTLVQRISTPALWTRRDMTKIFTEYSYPADMNPAHIVRECLTNTDWGMGLPTSMIDDASFTAAADTLYAEGFGLSLSWTGQSSIEEFINEILNHIDGAYGVDPATGKLFIKLIRGGYSLSGLFELTPDNCRITSFQRKAVGELTNEIVVTWTNPQTEQEETVVVHDLANFDAQGGIISSSRNYYGIRTSALALRCAMRELGKASQATATFEVEANRSAWAVKSGDVVKVTYPEYGLNQLPCRVASVNYGAPGSMGIKIALAEDVFDMPATAYTTIDGSLSVPDPDEEGTIAQALAITAPYYFVAKGLGDAEAEAMVFPEAYGAFLLSSNATDIDVYYPAANTVGEIEYTAGESVNAASSGMLVSGLVKESISTFQISNFVGQPVSAGWFCFIDTEIGVVESVSGSTYRVRRGMLDTVPSEWEGGTRVMFVSPDYDLNDGVVNSVGSSVNYMFRPTNGSTFASATVAYDSRSYRPYRPANVKINGSLFPTSISTTTWTVTWAHRNRITETVTPLKWDEASVTVEPGVTYRLKFYDGTTLTFEVGGLTTTTYTRVGSVPVSGSLRIVLSAERDGYTSYQNFDHTMSYL